MTVKVNLKELRSSKGISQNELARLLEMSLTNIQKIEYNKAKSIPFDTLESICKILKCEIGDLLVLNEGVKMSSIVYGIAQLELYNSLKNNYSDINIYELCNEIHSLEKTLDLYINDSNEKLKSKLRSKGEYLFNIGNTQLMFDICNFLGVKNRSFLRVLNREWNGIGDWLA